MPVTDYKYILRNQENCITINEEFTVHNLLIKLSFFPVKRRVLDAVVSRRSNNDETPIPGGNIVELLFTVDKALYDKYVAILL
jgi:hypothetical protein